MRINAGGRVGESSVEYQMSPYANAIWAQDCYLVVHFPPTHPCYIPFYSCREFSPLPGVVVVERFPENPLAVTTFAMSLT